VTYGFTADAQTLPPAAHLLVEAAAPWYTVSDEAPVPGVPAVKNWRWIAALLLACALIATIADAASRTPAL